MRQFTADKVQRKQKNGGNNMMPENFLTDGYARMTFENHYGEENETNKFTAEVNSWCLTIDGVINELVWPVLLAAGFSYETIVSRLGEYP